MQQYYNNPYGTIVAPPSVSTGYNTNIVQPRAVVNAPRQQQPKQPTFSRTIYYQKTTKNKSFLDMYHYLQSIGIKNCKFMLALVDPDLEGIDPHDPNLNIFYKQKVHRECMVNYWYYLREVVRLPSQGGKPMKYTLHRGNLAYNFCASLNFNIFFELPRQQYKTTSAVVRYLWIYNFGTSHSKIAFLHKGADGSKDNLQLLKDIRELLPPYLQFTEKITPDGKRDKGRDAVTVITNPFNNNNIKTFASATNTSKAASLIRGKTLTIIWFDEYAFLPHNRIIYMNGAPAFKTAANNARANGAPYGILITTTPGFMKTLEGQEAYNKKEEATRFSESWYDKTYQELMQIINANTKSDFIYIKFTYQELGATEEWFNEVCKLLNNSGPDIRREILLEWATTVDNSPFKEEDLDIIRGMVKEPINVCYLLGKYRFETYLQADTRTYPPIIGVDVSGGYKQDSSCITIIDSCTTKVLGCMNCNYISTLDLARCIEFIVKNWMPNAIVNVERNGGYGATVIEKLKKMGLRKNLYYEIKDHIVEERQDGVKAYKTKVRTKVFGLDSTKRVRQLLIDILIDRVENHKDKFSSPIIYNELLGMEVKRNGKVEHSASTHDDQVFSMLMALYCWYEGTNMAERFGLKKTTIKTDEEIDEEIDFNDETVEIVDAFPQKTEIDESIEKDIEDAIKAGGIPLDKFLEERAAQEKAQLDALIRTPMGENAYRQKYNIPKNIPIENFIGTYGSDSNIPDSVFYSFYNPTDKDFNVFNTSNVMVAPDGMRDILEDGEYSYKDHFNF